MQTRLTLSLALASALIGGAASAADPAKGESDFKRCRACHAITADDGTDVQKGGKTGPNLYGVVGRIAGSAEGFNYGDSLVAARDAGLVWDEDTLAAYIQDPNAFLKQYLDDTSAKSKMTFKLKKGSEDMAAYLATVSGGN